jgi:hypothetical protein
MPTNITPVKHSPALPKRQRWFLMPVILFLAIGLAWFGWQNGIGFVWIVFGIVLLLLFVIMVWGGKIAFWLARRLGHRILHNGSSASRGLINTGLQQGEKIINLSSKEIGKNIHGAQQVLGQARDNLGKDFRAKPGKVTWVSLPSTSQNSDAVCPACRKEVRPGAKFCDHCGTPLKHP